MDLIYQNDQFMMDQPSKLSLSVPSVSVPQNGSLFLHIILTKMRTTRSVSQQLLSEPNTVHAVICLTKFAVVKPVSFSLLADGQKSKQTTGKRPVSHWKPAVVIDMALPISLDRRAIPGEIFDLVKVNNKAEYLPIIYYSELRTRIKDLIPVPWDKNEDLPLTVQFESTSIGKIRFMKIAEISMKTLQEMGFAEQDTDDVKAIFLDTNLYLLLLTVVVTSFHLLFDFLAFKSDFHFWKNCNSMAGLSYRSLVWRSVSQVIITIYLYDQGTSLLVLGPAVVATVIEFWKLRRVSVIDWKRLSFKAKVTGRSSQEKLTDEHDALFMKYLSYYVLYPLVVAGSVYSLVYSEHKSWSSWAIQSAANGVYAFGFLFMLPQLFINYKLKSVAHLPWRMLTYKFLNTFIDDIFAFVIKMPTLYRLGCFRDDIIFLIYVYQRWIYRVDLKRVNEFGVSGEQLTGAASLEPESVANKKND